MSFKFIHCIQPLSLCVVGPCHMRDSFGKGRRTHRFVQAHDPSDSFLLEQWNVVVGSEGSVHTLLSAAACGATER